MASSEQKQNSILALTGGLLGLAYLTRPEAFAYPAYFVLIAIGVDLWNRRQKISRRLPRTFILLIVFATFAVPYLTYLRAQTGSWTISGKTQINSVMAEFAPQDGETSGEITAEEASSAGNSAIKVFIRYLADNLIAFNKILPFFIPTFLALLVGVGLFGTDWEQRRSSREAYLIGFCILTVVGYVATVVQLRYLYILLPIVFGWLALGMIRIQEWAEHTLGKSDRLNVIVRNKSLIYLTCAFCIYVYLFPINFWFRGLDQSWDERAYEERDAGLWLKANAKPSPVIFSAGSRVPFYAEGTQISPHSTDPNKVYLSLLEHTLITSSSTTEQRKGTLS